MSDVPAMLRKIADEPIDTRLDRMTWRAALLAAARVVEEDCQITSDRLAAAEATVERVREVARLIGQEHDVPLSVVVSLDSPLDDPQEATGAPVTASEAQDDPECHEKPADDGSKP